jgi:hypothetical protein
LGLPPFAEKVAKPLTTGILRSHGKKLLNTGDLRTIHCASKMGWVALLSGSGGFGCRSRWRSGRRQGRGLDDDGAGGGRGKPDAVGRDVVDGVGGRAARVEDDGGHEGAVEEGFDTEVEVGLRAGDGGTQVGVGGADLRKASHAFAIRFIAHLP